MTTRHATAARKALVSCHSCDLVVRPPNGGGHLRCPRCGAAVHSRKPNSIARTWALVIAAVIFYIPANLLPITVVYSLGTRQSDTIMSGVIYFLHHGEWYIALVIFTASIFIPILKLLILIYLLLSVQVRSQWRPNERTRLYRITEAVGRWSMIDVYVVTILVALVNLGNLMTIEAGHGALFFAAVVVLTMFAAASFDPRLIWDHAEPET